ncbi:DUF4393 domain-containing protein [Algicola sagamiensis]|uniref:DUF4393 domain-containing protein n=1 Tax=Algicola sagamiensis TaxID=163869 RepID=UPI00037A0871|nr:DUF4393 domain-containing protein [Algicola sagamiensis]
MICEINQQISTTFFFSPHTPEIIIAQDRLANYIKKSLNSVPEENRISPPESLILPIAEQLKYQEEGNPLTALYLNLLSRAMDKERIGEAHPAFINIIKQLSPDEVLILKQIATHSRFYFFRFREGVIHDIDTVSKYLEDINLCKDVKDKVINLTFQSGSIAQPEHFSTFIEHMVSLGLIIYNVQLKSDKMFDDLDPNTADNLCNPLCQLHLTKVGEMFFQACINEQ